MAADSPTDYRRGFDAAAADFDALGRHLWCPIGRATVAATGPRPGDRVLDACCGTGASAIPAAHAVGTDGSVDAVDVSPPMIDIVHAAALPQLHGHVADVVGWTGHGYDVVQAALGIFFFPDMEAGTRRLIGMARPGGRVGFTIWRRGAMEAPGEHLARAVNTVTGAPVTKRKPHLIDKVNEAEPYAAWLESLGLAEVSVITDDRRLDLTEDLAWLIITGSGYRSAITGLTDDQTRSVRDRYLATLAADGITEIDATTLIGSGTVPAPE
ncbi:class I SAM-dependent methyltransferase [Microlunatus parietis]|uniref:Trans-aconitate methyltransferase n=1 Tax=Microlunatus parietis TaxID=682979 RepID=A0A7Y9IBS9_9ACTN|nr:methyltransferase domain-containing protein [Microlunatus parietis]NYE73917.1 trans-aconitate methyltransferase [Microlunatus parietis]